MNINAVDLFCGVGGLTHGLEKVGINVVAGIDIEESCRFPYEANNNAKFIKKDIKEVTPAFLNSLYPENTDVKILVGCAPCQPFSSYSYRYNKTEKTKNKMDLLDYFGHLVEKTQPDIVSMENVPQMINTNVFETFLLTLCENNYEVDWEVVYTPDYDVPQNRKRLILVAKRYGSIKLIEKLRTNEEYLTVGDIIKDLPNLTAGETDINDPLHTTRRLAPINIKRIQQSVPGGTWEDWEVDLLPNCYKRKSGKSYKSVYGRIAWDKPSPTLTTQFIAYGSGRFGHPEQDRALSLREGAMLQTFPRYYQFTEGKVQSMDKIAMMIGNAVPVKLGEVIGKSILAYIK